MRAAGNRKRFQGDLEPAWMGRAKEEKGGFPVMGNVLARQRFTRVKVY